MTGRPMQRAVALCAAAALTASLSAATVAAESEGNAKSAILLIGDGMGLAQTYSAQIYAEEVLDESLVMTDIEELAVTRTHSMDSMVTDFGGGWHRHPQRTEGQQRFHQRAARWGVGLHARSSRSSSGQVGRCPEHGPHDARDTGVCVWP